MPAIRVIRVLALLSLVGGTVAPSVARAEAIWESRERKLSAARLARRQARANNRLVESPESRRSDVALAPTLGRGRGDGTQGAAPASPELRSTPHQPTQDLLTNNKELSCSR